MTGRHRFDVLLAVSDVLVMTACQRAYSRSISRRTKYVPMRDRHRAYELVSISEEKIEAALADAWTLCPALCSRHQLGVDVDVWVGTLDSYTRSLLLMSMPHAATRLSPILAAAVGVRDFEPGIRRAV
jgi:hypothetical protein